MDWFGLSLYGVSDPIKTMCRADYVEPTTPRDLMEVYASGRTKGSFAEMIKEIDVYIGQADGYTYKSYDRLIKMNRKGNFKPIGPVDMYRYPGCTSMTVGWFLADPALKDETWFKTVNRYV